MRRSTTPSSTATGTWPNTCRRWPRSSSRRGSRSRIRHCGGSCLPTAGSDVPWHDQTPEERAATRTPRGPWWGAPSKQTIDLATALFPALLHERLDEIGIDFGVVYPSLGLVFLHAADDSFRRGACRALNRCNAETSPPVADRLTPVAAIPMHTPEEAVAEFDYAVGQLGFKAVLVRRLRPAPVRGARGRGPGLSRYAFWLDQFGLDSAHDYDPVWVTGPGARGVDRLPLRLHRHDPYRSPTELRGQPPVDAGRRGSRRWPSPSSSAA